jgi:hypothetical protein
MNEGFLKDSFYLHSDSRCKPKDADRQLHLIDWLKINEQFEKMCQRIEESNEAGDRDTTR